MIKPRKSGSFVAIGLIGRDEVYSAEIVKMIKNLEEDSQESKVNIHGLRCVHL
ncbi:hypothetical protein [Paenisporosarcina antarctica]|uniref:hypothetical protein n=1 Tax=Paenisporosarcina antarctica TaxID=417367 RepID=UPI001416EDC7|nr:hypothetical protein [Paenisporosarcina antarctica]